MHRCLHHQLGGTFGVPATITTERDVQFTSALWTDACTSLGIKHVLTTAYHPQSNGMVELMHRQMKDALCAHWAGPMWHSHLPWVLMGLHAAPMEDSAVSSAELVNGSPLILPGQLLHVPDAPHVDVPPRPQVQHPMRQLSICHRCTWLGRPHVRVSCRPAEASGSPICQHLPGGLQGGQDIHQSRWARGRRSSPWTA
jgi:transposase InsO family protein